MNKSKIDKPDPNDIAPVTIEIKKSKLNGLYKSPLLKSGVTTIYVPRYKAIYAGDKLIRLLNLYIGTDKVNNDKNKWIENAQHLFLNKSALKTFLEKYNNDISMSQDNVVLKNAEYLIKHIYFSKDIPFRYNSKIWRIKSLENVKCWFPPNTRIEDTARDQYKRDWLRRIRLAYERELKEATEGVTNSAAKALAKSQLDKEFAGEYQEFQSYIKDYKQRKVDLAELLKKRIKTKENLEKIKATGVASVDNIKKAEDAEMIAAAAYKEENHKFNKTKSEGGYKELIEFIEKKRQETKNQTNILCSIELKVEERKKLLPSKADIKTGFNTIKQSCRKGDHIYSKKQKSIIDSCIELCKYPKYSNWCNTCSGIINCTLSLDKHIDIDKIRAEMKEKAASLIAAKYKTSVNTKKKKAANKQKATKKKVQINKISGGRKSRRYKKRKCSRRGSNP
jgi:hypothetical protein